MYLIKSCNYDLPSNVPKIYLAGNMGTPWRDQFIKDLSNQNVVVIDPTNEDYQTQDFNSYRRHCYWELDMIQLADMVVVWLDETSIAPISLFEIGYACNDKGHVGDKIILGVDKKYPKRKDLLIRWSYFFNKVANTQEELFENLMEKVILKQTLDESLAC